MERIAKFHKVSKEQFIKDFFEEYGFFDREPMAAEKAYEQIKIPVRATEGSAGYDFVSPVDFILEPGEVFKIPTGIRCQINEGWVLNIYPRSSIGFKYQTMLCNTVGIIDSDYFNANNEGHIWIKLRNDGTKDLVIKAGDRICQGIFSKFGITIDDAADGERIGGIGSSGE